jgi:hypothetical protein
VLALSDDPVFVLVRSQSDMQKVRDHRYTNLGKNLMICNIIEEVNKIKLIYTLVKHWLKFFRSHHAKKNVIH